MNQIVWPYFDFIKMFVIGLIINLDKINGLAISKVMLIKKEVIISFFEIFLW